jgi:hypothetical protein
MPPSFSHKFTLQLNFCDSYSKEKAVFFTLGKSHVEIGFALRAYCRERVDRLKYSKIGTWKTDNGKEFRGNEIESEHGAARELAIGRAYLIPYVSETNPVAERNLGVVQNAIPAASSTRARPPASGPRPRHST